MNRLINVLSADVFDDLRNAFSRFLEASKEALDQVNSDIAQTDGLLYEADARYRGRIERLQDEIYEAEHDDDGDPGSAYAALAEAEENLDSVRSATRALNDVNEDYSLRQARFRGFLGEEIPKANARLAQLAADLEAYLAGGVAGFPMAARDQSSRVSTTPISVNAQGESNGTGSTLRQVPGIKNVAISEIGTADSHVFGRSDFKKVSFDEVVAGFETLASTVRPAVAKGANGDYFSKLDSQQGLSYEKGNRRIYDAFYGQDRIVLDSFGGRLTVTNGQHRLFVAKALGLTHVPAEVRTAVVSPPKALMTKHKLADTFDRQEVYFCGLCNRQQTPEEGIGCIVCGRRTVSWNLKTEQASAAQSKWKIINGDL